MKTILLILGFSVLSLELSAQVHFYRSPQELKEMSRCYKLGTKELMNGHYRLADSLLKRSMEIYSNPTNVYNYAVARLYLGDTVTFCKDMLSLSMSKEKDATKMYYSLCAKADTVFFDRKFQKLNSKKKARYTVVTVRDRFDPYKTVYVHDKRVVGVSAIPTENLLDLVSTDILAVYRIYPDKDTIYTYLTHPPEMIGGDDVYSKFTDENSNPLIQDTKRKLNLNKVSVDIALTINKAGNVVRDSIIGTNKPVENYIVFKADIKKIIDNMPKYKPAIYNHREVVCIKIMHLYFW